MRYTHNSEDFPKKKKQISNDLNGPFLKLVLRDQNLFLMKPITDI